MILLIWCGQCGGSALSNTKQDDICRPCSIVPNHSSYKSIICNEEESLSPSGCKESRGEFLAFLALFSCSSCGNQMHRNILVCFWWPWHYTTITRVSGQRCLLRPFVRFLASTSSCATDWRWTVNCLSGEMVLLYTMHCNGVWWNGASADRNSSQFWWIVSLETNFHWRSALQTYEWMSSVA